ncbi:MAG: sigma 54 modulation protein/ribosomal protein [Chthoniobacteraceae bacterium]|nr:sigma 54 modulation protein/ribosomal protein [Chthoniobacteraceae bacterium]
MQTANVNVPVKVTGRHVSITEAIKNYATGKVEHLHLDYPRIMEAQIILNVEKHRHSAEIILHCNNHITIEATHETDDMYASIDGVIAKIAQQMRKYKTKIMRSHRPRRAEVQHFEEQVLDLSGFDDHEEGKEPQVIQTERYPVKPMFIDEAVLQLEMSSRQFVVFLNAKTEKINVLHRRKDGGFGLMEPTFS